MPKRVLDFDAMWASDKLAACAEGAGAPPGASHHASAPSWIAERAAREESDRRELRVGAGPSALTSAAAIRREVVERFRRRGLPDQQAAGRQIQGEE